MNDEELAELWKLAELELAFRLPAFDPDRPKAYPALVCASVVLSVSMFSLIMVFWIQ